MREITMQVYEFDELSDTAKEKARNWWRSKSWDDDYDYIVEPIKAIGKILGMKADWKVGCRGEYVEFKGDLDYEVEDLSGVRALKWVWNNWIEPTLKGKYYGKLVPCEKSVEHPNGVRHVKYYSKATLSFDCPLTGTCGDMNLIETYQWMVEQVRKGQEVTVEEFVEDLESRLLKEFHESWEHHQSDEYIDEGLVANGYEFYEDGSVA